MRRFTPTQIGLALILLATALIRIHLLPIPLERDEGEYAYSGQLMLQGIAPYSVAANMKLPGTYAAHAVIMAIFGQTIAGIHFGLLLVNLGNILLVFFLAKRLFNSAAAVAAAAAYAALTISTGVGGSASHATHFVTLFALAATLLLIRRPGAALWPGILYGIAFLMKQHGVFFALFGLVYLLRQRSSLRTLATYSAGVLAPYAATCLILWRAGVFPNFWFWTITYARAYASRVPLSDGLEHLRESLYGVMIANPALWILAAVGLVLLFLPRKRHPRAAFAFVFLAFSFATTCPGLIFRGHYFLTLLPAIALLAGAAFSFILQRLRYPLLAWLSLACAVAWPLYDSRVLYFQMAPREQAYAIWGEDNPFPEAVDAAAYIRDQTTPGALVAVLGSEPEIYFYAHRHSATSYIYMYGLMEPQPYALKMQKDVIADIEKTSPQYIVDVDVARSWLVREDSHTRIFDWEDDYLARHYNLAKKFNDLSIYRRRP